MPFHDGGRRTSLDVHMFEGWALVDGDPLDRDVNTKGLSLLPQVLSFPVAKYFPPVSDAMHKSAFESTTTKCKCNTAESHLEVLLAPYEAEAFFTFAVHVTQDV